MIMVSACLLGINCRYDGESRPDRTLLSSDVIQRCVPVCPEQLGGLSTPRAPSEIIEGEGADVLEGKSKIISSSGVDVTDCFIRGANEVLRIAECMNIRTAIMKEKSPSCGVCHIKRKEYVEQGSGVTTALLMRHGIRVISSDMIREALTPGTDLLRTER